jgi:hypothetical protein
MAPVNLVFPAGVGFNERGKAVDFARRCADADHWRWRRPFRAPIDGITQQVHVVACVVWFVISGSFVFVIVPGRTRNYGLYICCVLRHGF